MYSFTLSLCVGNEVSDWMPSEIPSLHKVATAEWGGADVKTTNIERGGRRAFICSTCRYLSHIVINVFSK